MSVTQEREERETTPEPTDDERDDTTSEQAYTRLLDTYTPDYWDVVGGGAMVAAGLGIIFQTEALLLAPVVAIGVLAARSLSSPPRPDFGVSRSLTPESPDAGETVTVETTIRNRGDRVLPDCRFIDLVPEELRVTSGAPRLATRLEPGETCTIEYEIEAESGNHRFEGVQAIVSDRMAARERQYELTAPSQLQCRYDPDTLEIPVVRRLTTPYAGRLATDDSGDGLEFYAVREYRPGDSLRRIDWNQYASSRELTTLQFRTQRSTSIVLFLDLRQEAYVRTDQSENHAVDRSIEAASRLLVTLLEEDHRVGLATLGPDVWIPPSDTSTHRTRVLDAFSTEPAFTSSPPENAFPVRLRAIQLLQRLTEPSQILLCTPLVDDTIEVPIQLLESAGHEVTVISPDPTRMDSRGGVVATLDRQQRIGRIHGYGVPVIDWPSDMSLDVAVARTMKGWSQ
jgi:uncharacterized repeat protein (TIGR01451 family)